MIDTGGRWTITDHVCRVCLGRILERNGAYLCSICEVTASLRPNAICGCGMRGVGTSPDKDLPRLIKQAYHCGQNPVRGPGSPARIAILFADGTPAKAEP
jgi:hypothetical protein